LSGSSKHSFRLCFSFRFGFRFGLRFGFRFDFGFGFGFRWGFFSTANAPVWVDIAHGPPTISFNDSDTTARACLLPSYFRLLC